jgi:hypothetical protein
MTIINGTEAQIIDSKFQFEPLFEYQALSRCPEDLFYILAFYPARTSRMPVLEAFESWLPMPPPRAIYAFMVNLKLIGPPETAPNRDARAGLEHIVEGRVALGLRQC